MRFGRYKIREFRPRRVDMRFGRYKIREFRPRRVDMRFTSGRYEIHLGSIVSKDRSADSLIREQKECSCYIRKKCRLAAYLTVLLA